MLLSTALNGNLYRKNLFQQRDRSGLGMTCQFEAKELFLPFQFDICPKMPKCQLDLSLMLKDN